MDFLQAEIIRKRKEIETIAQKNGSSKYVKRADVERHREEMYLKEQHELELSRKEKRLTDEQSKIKQQPKIEIQPISLATIDESFDNADIIKRLRLRGQPIKLFGESDIERIQRLKKCEVNDIRQTNGQTNELRALLQAGEKGLTEDLLKGIAPNKPKDEENDKYADVDTSVINLTLLKENPSQASFLITIYLKRITREWGLNLQNRKDEIKRSVDGKLKTGKN